MLLLLCEGILLMQGWRDALKSVNPLEFLKGLCLGGLLFPSRLPLCCSSALITPRYIYFRRLRVPRVSLWFRCNLRG